VSVDQHSHFNTLRLLAHIRRRGEAAKFEFIRLHLLTYPSRSFDIFGEAAKHGVRVCSFIRATAQRADVRTTRKSPTFTFLCVLRIYRFAESLTELSTPSVESDLPHCVSVLDYLLYQRSEGFQGLFE